MNSIDPKMLREIQSNAVKVARKSGDILKKYWGNLSNVQQKEFPWDLVTEADKQSEDFIIKALKEHFPSHQILAEESGKVKGIKKSEFLWVVDPLDGTTNFTHQFPFVAVSLGLLYQNEPILGVVYNPLMEEMFQAANNLGAYLNEQKIVVSSVATLDQSLLTTGFAYDRRETWDNNFAEFCHLTNLCQGVRRIGSAALDLAYVAAGRFDGYWERGLKPWDMAAGIVLVREAGGEITDYDLKKVSLNSGRVLASNGLIHGVMSQELLKIRKKASG